MVLPIPDLEPRLQRRYQQLVKEHLHTNESVAAGPRALPGVNQAFASTQAAWRFYANPHLTLKELAAPLIAGGRNLSASQCQNYALIMHDWSDLHYGAHTRKTDRIPLGKDQGYQLETALLVSDRTGLPLTPLSLSLWAADGIHTTRGAEVATDHSHLEEWRQESAAAIAKRLLIAVMACVVVWQVQRDDSTAGAELRQLLLRLSGRQVRRGQATAPALLSGMWVLLAMLDVMQHYDLAELKQMARVMLPGYSFDDTG